MINQKMAKRVGDRLKVNWNKVDLSEFTMGMNEELEHRDVTKGDYLVTGKIALAHLRERPDYYTMLRQLKRRR